MMQPTVITSSVSLLSEETLKVILDNGGVPVSIILAISLLIYVLTKSMIEVIKATNEGRQ